MQRRSALVTGGRSGIGAAIVAALERDGARVDVLDIADGFDVSDASAWEAVGAVDLACLNAGVVTAEPDPLYALTKHAVVGFVRSVAPKLLADRGIRLNMVNPGFVDTPLLGEGREAFVAAGFPLLKPEDVADAVLRAADDEEVGQAWIVQPGREPLKFRFPNLPGPRVPGKEGMRPPL